MTYRAQSALMQILPGTEEEDRLTHCGGPSSCTGNRSTQDFSTNFFASRGDKWTCKELSAGCTWAIS